MAQTAALAMVRMVNAVAWKMPLPAPAWFGEMQTHDSVRPLLESFQHQTASYWQDARGFFRRNGSQIRSNTIAGSLKSCSTSPRCDVNTPMNELGTDLTSVWRRAFRYRAEREATANALRVREGKTIETSSRLQRRRVEVRRNNAALQPRDRNRLARYSDATGAASQTLANERRFRI